MYWASLLRDVAFTDYASNATAAQAAAELSSMPAYLGPRDESGNVTPDLLFRGTYPGDTLGPYLSQFHLQPTFLGTQPLAQQMVTFLPDIDYMTDATTYQQIQNGINTGASLQFDPQLRYLH
ncbi:MAG: phosphoesterase, partial [Verrucomicrobia bacterium]